MGLIDRLKLAWPINVHLGRVHDGRAVHLVPLAVKFPNLDRVEVAAKLDLGDSRDVSVVVRLEGKGREVALAVAVRVDEDVVAADALVAPHADDGLGDAPAIPGQLRYVDFLARGLSHVDHLVQGLGVQHHRVVQMGSID